MKNLNTFYHFLFWYAMIILIPFQKGTKREPGNRIYYLDIVISIYRFQTVEHKNPVIRVLTVWEKVANGKNSHEKFTKYYLWLYCKKFLRKKSYIENALVYKKDQS